MIAPDLRLCLSSGALAMSAVNVIVGAILVADLLVRLPFLRRAWVARFVIRLVIAETALSVLIMVLAARAGLNG